MITFNLNWYSMLQQIAPWGVPLCAALLILFVGPFLKKSHLFSFGVAFVTALVSIFLAWRGWIEATGDAIGFLLFDKFTYLFILFFLLALVFVLLLSHSYLKSFGIARPEYYALLLFMVFGMGCMVSGSNLMVIFLGLEIMSVSVYVLCGFQRTNVLCVEASLKYFLVGAFASAFLLLGIAFIYGATNTTDIIALHQSGAMTFSGDTKIYALLGLSLMVAGLAFKIAIVPFHFWAPDVYEGAPVVVTTFMATAVKAAGFAALLRIIWALFQWDPVLFTKVVWIGSALTMTVGNVAALLQRNLKRMLAYSSVAHAGYALIPLVAFPQQSSAVVASIGFYLLTYILMTVGAFAVLIALIPSEQSEREGEAPPALPVEGALPAPIKEHCDMQYLRGMGVKKPFLGFVMTVFLLSLAGIPPTMGFFGKYYMFLQAVQAGSIWLVVIGLLNSVISVYYYLGPVVVMYFGGKEETRTQEDTSTWLTSPAAVTAVIWICFLSVSLLGLFPSNLLELIQSSTVAWLS
ncbi:MAG: NADH-quinone oxidoreductase subunit N [Deltaproteobacteria bacterium]|nr:NADH-quinone oxidoreductase subunit N [Deltaproteobacteria bacterium]